MRYAFFFQTHGHGCMEHARSNGVRTSKADITDALVDGSSAGTTQAGSWACVARLIAPAFFKTHGRVYSYTTYSSSTCRGLKTECRALQRPPARRVVGSRRSRDDRASVVSKRTQGYSYYGPQFEGRYRRARERPQVGALVGSPGLRNG